MVTSFPETHAHHHGEHDGLFEIDIHGHARNVPQARSKAATALAFEATLLHGVNNGRVESLNTKIRLIARRAFGLHSAQALIALSELTLGGLCPPLPLTGPTAMPEDPKNRRYALHIWLIVIGTTVRDPTRSITWRRNASTLAVSRYPHGSMSISTPSSPGTNTDP